MMQSLFWSEKVHGHGWSWPVYVVYSRRLTCEYGHSSRLYILNCGMAYDLRARWMLTVGI